MAKKSTNTTEAKPDYKIRAIYIKDISFENPNAPAAFMATGKPNVSISFDIGANKLEGTAFESVLKAEAGAKSEDGKTLFLIEISYAGIFVMNPDLGKEKVQEILAKEAPKTLLPYVRQKVAELSRDGGYSPLIIDHMEFKG